MFCLEPELGTVRAWASILVFAIEHLWLLLKLDSHKSSWNLAGIMFISTFSKTTLLIE